MNVALDLGSHACRSLRLREGTLARRRCRSIVALLTDGEAQRTWLKRLQIPSVPCDEHLAVPGDFAEELAKLFPVACQDLLAEGKVPYADPVTRQLLALLVETLLPPATDEDHVCCFTHPGFGHSRGAARSDFDRRLEFVSRLIRLRGYEPRPVHPAVALALAEMEPERYAGIAVCLGASGCDLALVRHGEPVATLRLPRGGRWIDEELARHARLFCLDPFGERIFDLEAARRRKETFSLTAPRGGEQQLVADLYRKLIDEIVQGIERLHASPQAGTASASPPLTIVAAGGPTQIEGFLELLHTAVPGSAGTIRRAPTDEYATCRGCLIHATLARKPSATSFAA